MGNSKKRIEGLHEIFLSEKTYIEDMILWESEFRKYILNFTFLSLKVKYEICDLIFINMYDIKNKHIEIYNDMKQANLEVMQKIDPSYVNEDEFCIDKDLFDNEHVLSLEYASIYMKHISFINLYYEYVSRLPKAEYEIEKLCYYSEEFKNGLENFLKENNIEYLGVRNYLYRPSTKLARNPLLLKAIEKHEDNPEIKEKYQILIEKLKILTSQVDATFGVFSSQFQIYRLLKVLKYKETIKKQMELALYQDYRMLLKEGEVLLRVDLFYNPVVVKVYIFDHVILFCDIPKGSFVTQYILYEPLFIDRIIVFKDDLGFNTINDNFHPLFLLETIDNRIRTLLFDDSNTRNLYYKMLRKAQKKSEANISKDIELIKLNTRIQEEIQSACYSNKYIQTDERVEYDEDEYLSVQDQEVESESSEENTYVKIKELFNKDEVKRAVSEYANRGRKERSETKYKTHLGSFHPDEEISDSEEVEQSDEDTDSNISFFQKVCHGHEIFSRVTKYEVEDTDYTDLEYLRKQSEMLIVSTKTGIYMILDNEKRMIYEGPVKKVLYDYQFELLMFQVKSTLFISRFNCTMSSIEKYQVKNNIGQFFYGINQRGAFIATSNYGKSKSSLIYLFMVNKSEKVITVDLLRKLYVGFKVYNIIFSPSKIVIACKDFEIVDMDTLRTEEFLSQYDSCIPILFSLVPNAKAASIFIIDSKTYLACFDTFGFFVDDLGRVKRTGIIFLWKNIPSEFKIYYRYIITIHKKGVDVYNINNGILIYSKFKDNLKFIEGASDILLHDETDIYKLEFKKW